MIMALATPNRKPQPNGAGRVHPIHNRFNPKLLLIDSTFLIDRSIPMKSCCNFIIKCCTCDQITRKLQGRKTIKRHVRIQCRDNPIAIFPDRARAIDAVAIRIRIACLIQPKSAPAFAILRRIQQAGYNFFIGIGRFIVEVVFDFYGRRRYSSKI